MRETAGSAAPPAARCRKVLRGSFISNLPSRHSITSSARGEQCFGSLQQSLCSSGAEDEACAGIGAQEFVRYFGLRRLVERLTSAVQWNDVVDVHILDRRYRVAHIVFLIGCKVEAPDDCVNFVDARSRLGLFDRVDHPAMAAGGQYD